MKRIRHILLILAVILTCGLNVSAEIQYDYTVDFNTSIQTSLHDFRVAPNWKHIVDKYDDGSRIYYMSYSYNKSGGRSGSGAIYAAEQKAGDSYDNKEVYDLLVTPNVYGEVSLWVKLYSGTGYVEFYTLNDTGTARAERIARFSNSSSSSPQLSESEWRQVKINVDDLQRIGIRASRAYIDDFKAEEANIEPERSIKIESADPKATTGTIYWDQIAGGKVVVKYTVTVTNDGEVDLTPGERGYSVSIINGKTSETYATTDVPQALAVGETSLPFDVVAEIESDKVSAIWPASYNSVPMNLRENLYGSVVERAQSNYNPYTIKFIFRKSGSTQSSSQTDPVAFGVISEDTSLSYEIANNGVAPMEITSVELPEGFSSNFPAGGTTVEKGTPFTLDITLSSTAKGLHSGDLKITYLNEKGASLTYVASITGTVVAPGTWSADFNNTSTGKTPLYPSGSVAEAGIQGDYTKYIDGVYDVYLTSWGASDYAVGNNKFITPLLHAESGDKLTFDAGTTNTSSSAYFVKVYVSSDRVNWGDPVLSLDNSTLATSMKSFEINFPEAGDWYVGFAIYGGKVDNIVGLTQVAVDHDIYFIEFSQTEIVQTGVSINSTVKILPLTNEAADSYTVSYVVDGQTVATLPAQALTADSKNTKTFYLSYTPDYDVTKTVETYYVFDFGGTVFKTETRSLTVTCQPDFVFFDKGQASGGITKPSSRVAPIDFGITNTPGVTLDFEIFNWGTAPLNVKSISIPEGFEVSATAPLTVAAKERQEVNISFSTETPGNYSGDLEIVYVDADGSDKTYTLGIIGKMLDPSKWYASFDNKTSEGLWPAGSLHQKSVELTNYTGSYTEPDCAITCSSSATSKTPNNLFTTPLLKAEAGETFSFDAFIYSAAWTEGIVKVYYAASRDDLLDENTCTLLDTFSGKGVDQNHLMSTDPRTFSVNIPESGEFYIGIKILSRARVDNLYGLTLIDRPAEFIVSNTEFPATGVQNTPVAVTVDIINIGTREALPTDYDVCVYIDGIPSTTTVEEVIPVANRIDATPSRITPTFLTSQTGRHNVWIEITSENTSYKSDPVEIELSDEKYSGETVAGTPSGTTNTTPISSSYRNSETLSLYTPEILGLEDGEIINRLTWKGYSTISEPLISDIMVYYMLTDDTSISAPEEVESYDTIDMDRLASIPGYKWEAKGSKDELVDLLTIDLSKPIVYEEGKSLMILVRSTSSAYKYGIEFEKGKETGLSYYHRNDGDKGIFTSTWTAETLPVLHLGLKGEPTVLSGEVTAAGRPAAGATLTFTATDGSGVGYTTTTDTKGQYSLSVIQNRKTYDVTIVSADGKYAKYTDCRAFPESETLDISLSLIQTLNDDTTTVEAGDDNIIVWQTIFPEGFSAIVLPFDLDGGEVAEIFGEDALIHEFIGDEGKGAVKAKFGLRVLPGLEAGVPYLIYLEESSRTATLRDKKTISTPVSVDGTSLTFTGTFSPVELRAGMFIPTSFTHTGSDKAPKRAPGSGWLAPFRAFFRSLGSDVNTVTFTTDSDLPINTGIDTAISDEEDEPIYDLNGFTVTDPAPGIYIRNGKKIVIK